MTNQTMRDFGIGEGQIFVGGRWADSASQDRREIQNPKDEQVIAAVAKGTIEDADRAIAAAAQGAAGLECRPHRSSGPPSSTGWRRSSTRTARRSPACSPPKAARSCRICASTSPSRRCCCAMPPRAPAASKARSSRAKAATSRSGSSAFPMASSPASPPGIFRRRSSPARSARPSSPAIPSSSSRMS